MGRSVMNGLLLLVLVLGLVLSVMSSPIWLRLGIVSAMGVHLWLPFFLVLLWLLVLVVLVVCLLLVVVVVLLWLVILALLWLVVCLGLGILVVLLWFLVFALGLVVLVVCLILAATGTVKSFKLATTIRSENQTHKRANLHSNRPSLLILEVVPAQLSFLVLETNQGVH